MDGWMDPSVYPSIRQSGDVALRKQQAVDEVLRAERRTERALLSFFSSSLVTLSILPSSSPPSLHLCRLDHEKATRPEGGGGGAAGASLCLQLWTSAHPPCQTLAGGAEWRKGRRPQGVRPLTEGAGGAAGAWSVS